MVCNKCKNEIKKDDVINYFDNEHNQICRECWEHWGMKIKGLPNVSEFCNEMIKDCMKDMNWYQRLIFSLKLKFDDIWVKILMNTKYRKYKS